jgi:hypothetical protein
MSASTAPRLLILTVAVVATVAGTATAAQAAPAAGTVSVQGRSLTFRAGDDVANDLHVLSTQDNFVAVIDAAAPVTLARSARDRCEQDGTFVRCTGITSIRLVLGNRNDNLEAEGFQRLEASGQSGDDTLDAGFYEARVTLRGNDGNDTLIGGNRSDRLDAGSGSNQLANGNAGEDRCTGSNLTRVSCEN